MTEKSVQRMLVIVILAVVLVLGCIPTGAYAVITCPAGYQCMAETAAAAQWGQGNFVKYSSGVCGTDIDMTVYYYCYAEKTQLTCPAGYLCIAETDAISRWGQGNFVKFTGGACGTNNDQSVYYYCFAQKLLQTCPAGSQCMSDAKAAMKWGNLNYEKYSTVICSTGGGEFCYGPKRFQCPVGSSCLSKNDAEALWGPDYCTRVSSTECWHPAHYCYAAASSGLCPSGSGTSCLSENAAKNRWGQGNYRSAGQCGEACEPTYTLQCYGPKTVPPTTPSPTLTIPVVTISIPSGQVHVCAQVPCEPPKVLYCPDKCPGGCGVRCVLPKEIPTPPLPAPVFVFSGIVDEWRFDADQDMWREAPRTMQRVNNETILLYGSYYPTGFDTGDYIASGTSGWNGEYSISLGPGMPHRNYTYYFLSPAGTFNGRPFEYVNASSIYGHVRGGRYNATIYYRAPLNAGQGSGNNFMFYTRNTTTTGPNPAAVLIGPTPVYPGIIVTPPRMVQQTPPAFNGFPGIFSPIADFIRNLFGGRLLSTTSAAVPTINPQDINTNRRANPADYLPPCPDATIRCQNACVDQLDDNSNCGSCGNVCPQGTICIDGTCGSPDALPGSFYCDDPTSQSMTGNPRTNPYCCGGYGHKCGADKECIDGQCICLNGKVLCNGICRNLTSDPANCGACGNSCPSRQSCLNGRCSGFSSMQPDIPVADIGKQGMVPPCNLKGELCMGGSDCYWCPDGMFCNQYRFCEPCNSTGQLVCYNQRNQYGPIMILGRGTEEVCINSLSDPKNCGSCNNVCKSGTTCCNGKCVECGCGTTCNAGQRCCDGRCICDTCTCPSEPENVICPSGQTNCNGWCIDKQTNKQNCGSCGKVCAHNCGCEDGTCCTAEFDPALKTWICDC